MFDTLKLIPYARNPPPQRRDNVQGVEFGGIYVID